MPVTKTSRRSFCSRLRLQSVEAMQAGPFIKVGLGILTELLARHRHSTCPLLGQLPGQALALGHALALLCAGLHQAQLLFRQPVLLQDLVRLRMLSQRDLECTALLLESKCKHWCRCQRASRGQGTWASWLRRCFSWATWRSLRCSALLRAGCGVGSAADALGRRCFWGAGRTSALLSASGPFLQAQLLAGSATRGWHPAAQLIVHLGSALSPSAASERFLLTAAEVLCLRSRLERAIGLQKPRSAHDMARTASN